MFIKLTNGKPETYTIGQLRRDNPQTSFPKDIPAEILASYDVYAVKRTPIPAHNDLTEVVRMIEPLEIDGQWTQQWEVVALPIEQQIENVAQARAEAYAAESDPLFFKAQRGEIDEQVWLDKVQEIRDRFPDPVTNVNTASKSDLRKLKGIDAVRAQAIIDGRPWSSTDDLATIQGISADMIAGWNIEV